MAQWLSFPGTTGHYAHTPHTTALNVSGDLEIIVSVKADLLANNQERTFIGRRQSTSQSQLVYRFYMTNLDVISLEWKTTGGVNTTANATTTTPASGDVHWWLRVTLDVDNGASGYDVKFYYSNDAASTAVGSVTWTQIGTTVTGGAVTSISTSITSLMELNSYFQGADNWELVGDYYQAIVRDGIGGTEIAHFDADDFVAGDTDTDTAVDSTGKTWTIHGASSIIETDTPTSGTYIVQEDGTGKITIEDDSGFLLLEEVSVITGVLFTVSPTFPAGVLVLDQTVTGTLFTRLPTFPNGALSQVTDITGTLFTRAPTFPTGVVSVSLSGVLYTRGPTFPAGAVLPQAVTLAGVLYTRAPTFPTGAVTSTRTLTGALFTRAPTFPAGTVSGATLIQPPPGMAVGTSSLVIVQDIISVGSFTAVSVGVGKAPTISIAKNLTGTLFTRAPVFESGVITSGLVLGGILYTRAPTFGAGAVLPQPVTVTGVLFSRTPVFGAGAVLATQTLPGTLFTRAPTFPTGAVLPQPVTLGGVLFARPPTFGAGVLVQDQTVSGVLFSRTPTFLAGVVTTGVILNGVLLSVAPTFPTGAVLPQAVTVTGILFARTPSFPAGAVTSVKTLAGVLFSRPPTFGTGAVLPQPVTVTGATFTRAPVFGVGVVNAAGQIAGILYTVNPVFPVGLIVGIEPFYDVSGSRGSNLVGAISGGGEVFRIENS